MLSYRRVFLIVGFLLLSSSTGLEQSLHDVETKPLWRRQGDYDSSRDDLGTRRHSVQQVSLVSALSLFVYSLSPFLPVSLSARVSIISVCPSVSLTVCLSI